MECVPISANGSYNHLIGSLKKGSKQTMSLPSTSYNTLPTNRHLRNNVSSPKFISQSNLSGGKGQSPRSGIHSTPPNNNTSHSYLMMSANKRSPSSTDSGHSSSNNPNLMTPLYQHHTMSTGKRHSSSKVQHHTVYLHGKLLSNHLPYAERSRNGLSIF